MKNIEKLKIELDNKYAKLPKKVSKVMYLIRYQFDLKNKLILYLIDIKQLYIISNIAIDEVLNQYNQKINQILLEIINSIFKNLKN